MMIEAAELTGVGAIIAGIAGGLWRGLVLLLDMQKTTTATFQVMQKEANTAITANAIAMEKQTDATRALTGAVDRLSGRVEGVERVVHDAKATTARFTSEQLAAVRRSA